MSKTTQPTTNQGNHRSRLRAGAAATVVAAGAVCCATPTLSLLGIALTGAAATAFTAAFAGLAFTLVIASVTVAAVVVGRKRAARPACPPGPADSTTAAGSPRALAPSRGDPLVRVPRGDPLLRVPRGDPFSASRAAIPVCGWVQR